MKSYLRFVSSLIVIPVVSLVVNIATAAPFAEGNLAIYRTTPQSPGNAPSAVFIDEYTPLGVLVQSIAMPTVGDGAQRAFTAQANATLEGLLNRSTDGRYLVLTGYDHNLGDTVPAGPGDGTLAQTTAEQVPRVIGRIDVEGNVDTSTWYNDSGQGSPRSVVSNNGINFWISQGSIGGGDDGGVRFTTFGSTGDSTSVSQDSTDTRHIDLFGGQLYVSSATSGLNGVLSVDLGTGTMEGLTGIPGGVTETNTVQFFMANLGNEIAGIDTAYVADMRLQNAGGGLHKYSLDTEGGWVLSGSIAGPQPSGEPPVSNLRGLTGEVDEFGNVTLYGTRNAAGGGQLLKFVDNSGYNGTLSGTAELLVTAEGTLFKGLDFVPIVSEGLLGDINEDGVVDAADYVAWRKAGGEAQAYFDWRSNFGASEGALNLAATNAVPEPATLVILGLVAICLVCGLRRRFAVQRVTIVSE